MARYYEEETLFQSAKDGLLKYFSDSFVYTSAELFHKVLANTPTADVVPKSEVDNWYCLYHSIKEQLKQEKIYHRETENLCDRYCIESQQAKKQVAREIFEEIDRAVEDAELEWGTIFGVKLCIAELKKKYTEGDV